MPHTATTISAPVSIADVQAVLATAENSVGRLCTLRTVNRWSRFKPIRDPRPAMRLTETTAGAPNNSVTAAGMGMTPEQDAAGAYGLNIVARRLDQLAEAEEDDDWVYLRPTGLKSIFGEALDETERATAATPFRLGDFENYMHNAVSPFAGELTAPLAIPNELNSEFTVEISRTFTPAGTDPAGPGSLTLAEIQAPVVNPATGRRFTFSQMYFGVAFYRCNADGSGVSFGTLPAIARCNATPGGRSLTASLNTSALAMGEHLALVPFYATRAIEYPGNALDTDVRLFSVPDVARLVLPVGSAKEARGIAISLRGSVMTTTAGNRSVSVSISITIDPRGKREIFRNNVLNVLDSAGNVISYHELNIISVGAGDTWTKAETFSTVEIGAGVPRRVELRLNASEFTESSYLFNQA